MTKNPKILSIVLAGGEGTRLMPLTRDRAKPAVPFGGVYRLIDFPLSNLVNSGYRQVVVLIYTMSGNLPPAKFVHAGRDRLGHATDSIVSPGVIVSGGEVHHSVLSPNVRIHSWAQIVDSVLFDGVVINRRARVYKAILDKNVVLTENSTVGIDTEHDLARGFTVTPDGITVVPKNTIVDD